MALLQNVEIEVTTDDVLLIRCDLKKELGPSGSGRSCLIATSAGNFPLYKDNRPHPKGIVVNLNVSRAWTVEEKLHGWHPPT